MCATSSCFARSATSTWPPMPAQTRFGAGSSRGPIRYGLSARGSAPSRSRRTAPGRRSPPFARTAMTASRASPRWSSGTTSASICHAAISPSTRWLETRVRVSCWTRSGGRATSRVASFGSWASPGRGLRRTPSACCARCASARSWSSSWTPRRPPPSRNPASSFAASHGSGFERSSTRCCWPRIRPRRSGS